MKQQYTAIQWQRSFSKLQKRNEPEGRRMKKKENCERQEARVRKIPLEIVSGIFVHFAQRKYTYLLMLYFWNYMNM